MSLTIKRRACLALLAAPAFRTRAADPGFAANFSDVSLLDQNARRFTFASLSGKVLLVNFVYTGCSTICPLQTRELVQTQAALPASVQSRVRFVSVSIDPLQDTPAALKAFAQRMGADTRAWSFVTGKPSDIDRVATRLRLFKPDGKQPDDHATSLWAVDAKGRLIQRYAGNPPDRQRLVRELGDLVALASR